MWVLFSQNYSFPTIWWGWVRQYRSCLLTMTYMSHPLFLDLDQVEVLNEGTTVRMPLIDELSGVPSQTPPFGGVG